MGSRTPASLDRRLEEREWVAVGSPTIADLALFGYTHVVADAGFDLAAHPAIGAWLDRVEATPGFENDLAPFPDHAMVTA